MFLFGEVQNGIFVVGVFVDDGDGRARDARTRRCRGGRGVCVYAWRITDPVMLDRRINATQRRRNLRRFFFGDGFGFHYAAPKTPVVAKPQSVEPQSQPPGHGTSEQIRVHALDKPAVPG